jgi:hypothetical protein
MDRQNRRLRQERGAVGRRRETGQGPDVGIPEVSQTWIGVNVMIIWNLR